MTVLLSVELTVNVPVPSLYDTEVAPPPDIIPPTMSSILSWSILTAPLDTLKSVSLNDATPFEDTVASAAEIVSV